MTRKNRQSDNRVHSADGVVRFLPTADITDYKRARLNELDAEYRNQETNLRNLQQAIKKVHLQFENFTRSRSKGKS